MGVQIIVSVAYQLTEVIMKFGDLFVLLVQTALPIQCGFLEPMFVTVDDVGQFYYVQNNVVNKLGPQLRNWKHADAVKGVPDDADYIAIAASNFGSWHTGNPAGNPAGILLSTGVDNDAARQIVTDTSWKCKAFRYIRDTKIWVSTVEDEVMKLPSEYTKLRNAVAISPNLSWTWGMVDNIQLGAQWIWYPGYDGGAKPITPNNVICIKKLVGSGAGK